MPRVDRLEQARDLLRRVLQIGIERDDDGAARVGESREHGSVLARVARERDHGHPMVFRLDDEEFLERPIGAPVVDIDDLGGTIERVEYGPDPCVELRETALLVEDRDHDRGGRRPGKPGCCTCGCSRDGLRRHGAG